jgi:hypothetical protein
MREDHPRGRTCVYSRLGPTMLIAHTSEKPDAEEWRRFCAAVAAGAGGVNRFLVYTDGGGPSAVQRKLLRESCSEVFPKTAVMTPTFVVRSIISAFTLFIGDRMKAFPPTDWEGACDYLAIPRSEISPLRMEQSRLKRELGLSRAERGYSSAGAKPRRIVFSVDTRGSTNCRR